MTVFFFLIDFAVPCTYCRCFSSCVFFFDLLSYRYDGYATIFKFKQNFFMFMSINVYHFAIVSFFCPLLSNLFFVADLDKNKIK